MPDNNNPSNVEYWELAEKFIEKAPELITGYADLAGVTVDLYRQLTPRELCEHFKNITW